VRALRDEARLAREREAAVEAEKTVREAAAKASEAAVRHMEVFYANKSFSSDLML